VVQEDPEKEQVQEEDKKPKKQSSRGRKRKWRWSLETWRKGTAGPDGLRTHEGHLRSLP
jgi:hypothetical protein